MKEFASKVTAFLKQHEDVQTTFSPQVDSRNHLNCAEVFALSKVMVLLLQVSTLITTSSVEDQLTLIAIFNEVALTLLYCLGLNPDSQIGSTQIRNNRNLNIGLKYPQLVLNAILQIFEFKAKHPLPQIQPEEPQSPVSSLDLQMLSQQEERLFSWWEVYVQQLLPTDFYDGSYMFTTMLK